MTEFSESRWANSEFAREYRDNADIFIVERKRMLEIMKSFYRFFISGNISKSVLDLGCGDGILTFNLLEIDPGISATLVDASNDMLCKAKERLARFNTINFIEASFQDIISKDVLQQKYDFAVSSFAIHHLDMTSKTNLFRKVYSHLNAGGYFMNIETILPVSDTLEPWYFQLWNDWMDEKKALLGLPNDLFSDISQRYKDADENKPDTLEDQLSSLKAIGFKEADCYYKYGIFAMFGGRK